MSISTRMIFVLTFVGLVSGGILASVGILTKDRIALNKQKEIEEAILLVLPGTQSSAVVFKEEDLTIYEGMDASNTSIGYAVLTKGTGFQDLISMMVGTDAELSRIRRLTILEQKETPGLGAKITSQEAFLQFWEDKDVSGPLSLRKPAAGSREDLAPNEVNTITGATISSQKVLEIVNRSLETAKKLKKDGALRQEVNDGN
jgi:electron transport complex protein RnfG